MKLKIYCTREHLKQSLYCGTEKMPGYTTANCWISLAVREILPESHVQEHAIQDAPWMFEETKWRIELPGVARKKIREFDSLQKTPEKRLELEPFEFEVEIDDETLDKINTHYGYNVNEIYEIINRTEHLELC